MATIQATAQQILKNAGWRLESKLGRGKQKWAKPGIAKKVYIGTHGSIRIGVNLQQSYCQVKIGALANKLADMDETARYQKFVDRGIAEHFDGAMPTSDRQYAAGKFHYSAYWNTWSAVLGVAGYEICEMTLTPVNPQYSNSWLKSGDIRKHCTTLERNDKITDNLPTDVLHLMYDNLGVEESDDLLVQARLLVF